MFAVRVGWEWVELLQAFVTFETTCWANVEVKACLGVDI